MKIVEALEESGLLIADISGTSETGFLAMLLGTLATGVLGKLFAGRRVIKADEGTIRVG